MTWNKTEEVLPPYNEKVLGFFPMYRKLIICSRFQYKWHDRTEEDEWGDDSHDSYSMPAPSHWMPLPAFPKEKR